MYNNYYVNYNLLCVDGEDKQVTILHLPMMTSRTTIVAILATTGQMGAGECVMQQHVATNHSTFRMLGNYTFCGFLGKLYNLSWLPATACICGVVNSQQVISADVVLKG